jgi:hypothetical protein
VLRYQAPFAHIAAARPPRHLSRCMSRDQARLFGNLCFRTPLNWESQTVTGESPGWFPYQLILRSLRDHISPDGETHTCQCWRSGFLATHVLIALSGHLTSGVCRHPLLIALGKVLLRCRRHCDPPKLSKQLDWRYNSTEQLYFVFLWRRNKYVVSWLVVPSQCLLMGRWPSKLRVSNIGLYTDTIKHTISQRRQETRLVIRTTRSSTFLTSHILLIIMMIAI